MSGPLAILTAADLEEIEARVATRVLAEFVGGRAQEPEYVSGERCGKAIGVSRTKMHQLRIEGAPCIKLGDTFRFSIPKVIAWLEAREVERRGQ